MGLFNLFKKRQPDKKALKEVDTQEHFNPLNIDSVINFMVKQITEKKPNATLDEIASIINDVLTPKEEEVTHLTEDGELPYGWYTINKDFIEKTETEYRRISNVWFNARNKGVLEQYAALKALVTYMKDVKAMCASKGECFVKWSTFLVANPNDLEGREAKLQDMEEHMEELLQKENMLKELRNDLKEIIKAEPGVKQEHLYKRFGPELKGSISNELYIMAANGVITREKSGRSYALYIK